MKKVNGLYLENIILYRNEGNISQNIVYYEKCFMGII